MRLPDHLLPIVLTITSACAWTDAAVNDSRTPVDHGRLNRVHVVYVTNRDREPLPGHRERLHRIMTDVQDFYRSEMARNGYGPVTFPLDQDEAGRTRVHLVTLDWDFDRARKFTPREIRPAIAKALADQGIDLAQSYFVAFLNAYWQDGNVWKYDVVYTGSGRPGHGATWVTDHALLDPANLDPKRTGRIDDRGHKLAIGQFNVKMMGGVAHEFGHSLGLPHNRERPEERVRLGKALMGAGNYAYRRERLGRKTGSFLTPAHAFILSIHPLFTRERLASFDVPTVSVDAIEFRHVDGKLLVSGTATPATHVTGVVLYHDKLPTGVNKDYDAWSHLADLGEGGEFVAAVDLPSSGGYALHMKVYCTNGTHRKFTFTHEIVGEIKPGLEALRRDGLWLQVKTAFERKDVESLTKHSAALAKTDPKRAAQAQRLLEVARQWQSFRKPSEVADDVSEVFLSSTRWATASVGWFIPSFNGVLHPDGQRLEPLASGSREYAQGLYAHASSRYEYGLDGRWKELHAKYGIQDGHRGTVVFVILADGKEVFRSPLAKLSSGVKAAKVDLVGVKKLELITEPGDDGKSSDWGVWLEPQLRR